MQIREDWEKKLIQEARKLVKHGWGEMVFLAKEEKEFTRITIKAGKWWSYKTEKKQRRQ